MLVVLASEFCFTRLLTFRYDEFDVGGKPEVIQVLETTDERGLLLIDDKLTCGFKIKLKFR